MYCGFSSFAEVLERNPGERQGTAVPLFIFEKLHHGDELNSNNDLYNHLSSRS